MMDVLYIGHQHSDGIRMEILMNSYRSDALEHSPEIRPE